MQTKPQNIDLDRLKESIDIAQLAQQLGLEVRGKQVRCFNGAKHKHSDKNPSLGLDLKTNRFKCFACGVNGSVIDLYAGVKGVSISQAIKDLAGGAGLQGTPRKTGQDRQTRRDKTGQGGDIYEALRVFCGALDKASLDYLTGATRGLTPEIINYFKVFCIKDYKATKEYMRGKFTPEQLSGAGLVSDEGNLIFYKHKVIVPFTEGGQIVFLQGRRTDDQHPRYMHLKTATPLFNTDTLKGLKQGERVYICEGVFDAMRLEQEGNKAVAILGVNNFKADQTGQFKGFNVILCLDNDESGKRATQELGELFLLKGQIIKTKELPDGVKDITDYFLKCFAKGGVNMADFENLPERVIEAKDKPRPATDFLGNYYQTLGNGETELLGIATGFKEIDKATLGLDGLIVLGGIAGQGKTSLALQLACNACDKGTPMLFYSLEMPRRAILTKLLNRLAKVRYSDILLKGRQYLTQDGTGQAGQTGQDKKLLSDEQAENLKGGAGLLKAIGTEFYIRSRERGEADINFETVEQEIEYLKALHNKKRVFVVIDHLQVFDIGNEYRDQIDKEGKLIAGFKGISERTGATILLISQKNKAGFTSKGLQTLKGSVDIVYLADVVMTLESKQEQGDKGTESIIYDNETKDIDLRIEKNRYNAPKTIKLEFNGEFSEFKEKP